MYKGVDVTFHDSPNPATTKMPVDDRVDKYTVVCSHNDILDSQKN